MCGIFGIASQKNVKDPDFESKTLIGKESIKRRGPDFIDTKYYKIDNFNLVLTHSRLAIISTTSDSHQPMHSNCGRWSIIYNGEIYNYIELKKELELIGAKFKSKSDTEVLLQSWIYWGESCLHKLNGMFAFCIFDKDNNILTLVRDRFGVKPLYYHADTDFIFSSSVSGIAKINKSHPNLNFAARGLYYSVYDTSSGESSFDDIYSLAPGTLMRVMFKDNQFKYELKQWYFLDDAVRKQQSLISQLNLTQLKEITFNFLQDAVRIRLRSDVPVAVSLSGGLDSSTIASLTALELPQLHGFTYGSEGVKNSEGPIVQRFSSEKNILTHYIWPRYNANELAYALERTLLHQEAPFTGLSVIAQNEIFREAKESGFKVLLGGQGGDEIFAGYRKFFLIAAKSAFQSKSPIHIIKYLHSIMLVIFSEISNIKTYYSNKDRYRTTHQPELSLLNWNIGKLDLLDTLKIDFTGRQIDDVKTYSIPTLLRYEDRNSMGHGLETRLPFMDYRLVELALALPVHAKISNGYGKYLLRNITENIVPNYIRLDRKKRGFDVTQNWIKDGMGQYLREKILSSDNLKFHYKKPQSIEKDISIYNLEKDPKILKQALTLAWLAEPYRV